MKPRERKFLKTIRRIPNQEGRLSFLRLDKNEHLDMVSSGFLRSFKGGLMRQSFSIYPEIGTTKKLIGKYTKISQKHIFLSHGSDAAIKQVFDVFAFEGSGVLLLKPTYAMYQIYASMAGSKISWVKCDNGLRVSEKELHKHLNKDISLACIANPNSPTGSEFSVDFLFRCLKKCQKLGIVLLIDEAYYPFSKATMMPYVSNEDNLIVTRTFSKAFALSGCRAGFMAVSSNLISSIEKTRPMYEINTLSCLAIKISLQKISAVSRYVQIVRQGRDFLVRETSRLGLIPYPVNTNFINIRLPDNLSASELERFGREKGILFKGSLSEGCLKNCVRVTLGPKKYMQRFVKLLKAFIARHE